MVNTISNFWSEHGGTICAGALGITFTLTMITIPYIQYFLL